MNTSIRQIASHEIDKVCEILKSVVAHMVSIGFTQWGDDYPTREILLKDIERRELYGAYIDDLLTGFVAINSHQSKEYEEIKWQFGVPYLVVHRLQVAPKHRGQNIGFDLMIYVEALAKEKGCKSIRLDTRCDNIPANKLYEKLGYKQRGHVHFPRMMEFEFPCFEKEIK